MAVGKKAHNDRVSGATGLQRTKQIIYIITQ